MKNTSAKLNKPLISVIITNYNYGQYITKAIESITSQTYPNIELIIINDGSTDDSDEVIKKVIATHPDKNIRYVNRENKGVVYTRNEGMELAKGEYISNLDADDFFSPRYISRSYKVAKETGVDVVYPNWRFVGDWLGRPDTDFPEFTPELLQLQELHVTPASLIKKKAIKNHRFEVEKVAEDWDFFIGLSLDGATFKLVERNPINYRIRSGTRGSKNDPKDDTRYFVEILNKYKNIYGDRVINPNRLVKSRHPNIVVKVFSMRYPRKIKESISRDGIPATTRKVLRKTVLRNKLIWNSIGAARNWTYQKAANSFHIETSPKAKLAVVLHLYYPSLWPDIKAKLNNINVPFDLFVSVQLKDKDIVLDSVNKYHGTTNIVALPNRGRDVLPFLVVADKVSKAGQYAYILKLHSKKSLHRKDGSEWLESLLSQLIPTDISNVVKTLEDSKTGVVGPVDHVVSLKKYMGANRERIGTIMESFADPKLFKRVVDAQSKYPYFGGTMFWCRVDFLSPLLESGLSAGDFDTERGQVDGTTAHAVERIFGKILHEVTDKKMYTIKDGIISELLEKRYNAAYKHVE